VPLWLAQVRVQSVGVPAGAETAVMGVIIASQPELLNLLPMPTPKCVLPFKKRKQTLCWMLIEVKTLIKT
jgi:hypothetical protein